MYTYEEEEEEEEEEEYELEEESETMRLTRLYQQRRHWEEYEAERVKRREAALASPSGSAGGGGTASSIKRTAAHDAGPSPTSKGSLVFTSKACFKVLSQELFRIREACNPTTQANSIGDDVHHWTIELGGFDPDSAFGQDLTILQHCCGYDGVHLRMHFKEDVHPFCPPLVEVVRPRLQGRVAGALMSHPRLHLANWDPAHSHVSDLIDLFRSFFAHHARVDLESEMNDPDAHPDGLLEDPLGLLDIKLAHLSALTGSLVPSVQALVDAHETHSLSGGAEGVEDVDMLDIDEAAALMNSKRRRTEGGSAGFEEGADEKEASDPEGGPGLIEEGSEGAAGADAGPGGRRSRARKNQMYWKKGTGYGHDDGVRGEVWDPAAARAAQAAQDEQIIVILEELSQILVSLLEAPASTHSPVIALLMDSTLPTFIECEMNKASFSHMCTRLRFYNAVVAISQAAYSPKLLGSRGRQHAPSSLLVVSQQAQIYLQSSHANDSPADEQPMADADEAAATAPSHSGRDAYSEKDRAQDELAQILVALGKAVAALPDEHAAHAQAPRHQTRSGAAASGAASSSAPSTSASAHGDDVERYCAEMRPIQLESGQLSRHHYTNEANICQPSRATIKHVAREAAGLVSDLPLHVSSSVFVRINENNAQQWSVLITGPEDTPYAGGCFVFDVFFPHDYPNRAPLVHLCTTGGGRVRFNPNLYACGKVCLSLLGTWSGASGESWDSATSSILQVLVSIQSLILVPQPYFNEPGYEKLMGSEQGDAQSDAYNANIRAQTIRYAMIEQLRHPRVEFASVISSHFRLRKQAIRAQVHAWSAEAREKGAQPPSAVAAELELDERSASSLDSFITTLDEELDKLGS